MKLSAVVISFNEEADIARCLQSLKFCDEIILVDSGSTDKTVEIARNYSTQVHRAEWKGYVAQKNLANSFASGKWILSIDADEEVSPELAREIHSALEQEPTFRAFRFPRKTLYSGKWIRHGGWYPNRLVRLFQKESSRWAGDAVHEYIEVGGLVGELKNPLIHHSFRGISDQVERNNRYSSLGAEALRKQGIRFSYRKLIWKPFTKFIETYLLKLGLMDGYLGLVISVSAAYSVFLKWAKLGELERGQTTKA